MLVKVVYQSCVDAIGVTFNIINVGGLPTAGRTVARATTGFQQRDGCSAAQADGNGTLKECPAGHATSADFSDDFVDDFTLLKNHVCFSFEQTVNEHGSKALLGVSTPLPARLLCSLIPQLDMCHERLEKRGTMRDDPASSVRYLRVLCPTRPVRVRSFSYVPADRSFLREQSHFHCLDRCPLAYSNYLTSTLAQR